MTRIVVTSQKSHLNKDKLTHSKPLFENLNALKVYEVNMQQHIT